MAQGNPAPSDRAAYRRMSRQRQKDTKPEILVRQLLHRLGHRFRTRNRDLPGSPDVANRSKRWAVFVHGCYWHAHEGCPRHTIPKRNREFWLEKFQANRSRDERARVELEGLGYRIVTIWECETVDVGKLEKQLRKELSEPAQSSSSSRPPSAQRKSS